MRNLICFIAFFLGSPLLTGAASSRELPQRRHEHPPLHPPAPRAKQATPPHAENLGG